MSYGTGSDQVRVDSEPVAGGMRFVLPPRPGGLLARAGVLMMLAAVGEVLLACFFLELIRSRGEGSGASAPSLSPAFWIFGFFLMGPAAVLFVLGALWRWGRTEITCVEGRLKVRERWKAFALGKRVPAEPVVGLEVRPFHRRGRPEPNATDPGFWNLLALYGRAPSVPVVVCYPRSWVLRLVEEMRPFLSGPDAAPVPVWDRGDPRSIAVADALWAEHPPPGLNLECEKVGSELRIHLHPGGWRGTPLALLGFGGVFMVAGLVLGVLWALGGVGGSGDSQGPPPGVLAAFVGVGVLVGAACCLQARAMARRGATVILDPAELRFKVSGGWRSREYRWSRDQVARIEVGPSGWEINHRPVPELKVALATGEQRGLLMGVPEAALNWLAARLRRELQR